MISGHPYARAYIWIERQVLHCEQKLPGSRRWDLGFLKPEVGRQARAHVRFPDTRRPAARILRCDDLHRRSDHHDASIHSGMDSSTFGDPRCANRCRPDYRDVSRARGLAVARGVELGACIGQTMAPSRWSSAHSPIHFGESEKGVWMTTDSRLERSFEVEHLPRRG